MPRRQFYFWALLIALLLLFVEAVSFIGLSILNGKLFAAKDTRRARESIVKAPEGQPVDLGPSNTVFGSAVHPYLGFVLDPALPRGAEWLKLHKYPISEFGFIDESPPIHRRSPETLLVGITGGSVAFFFSIQATDVLERELRKHPAFADKKIVFVRLALGGFKQPQQLMTIQYLLALGGELDILINLDGFNEVALYGFENAPNEIFFAYPRSWHLMLRGVPGTRDSLLLGKLASYRDLRRRCARFFSRPGMEWSNTLNFFWTVSDRELQKRERKALMALQMAKEDSAPYSATGPRKRYASEEDLYSDLVNLWMRSSLQMDRVCRANGISYFHFLQPNQYVADSKPMDPEERSIAISEDEPYRAGAERGYPLLSGAGRGLTRAGVDFQDLTMLFADVEEPVYSDSCCHLNDLGNDLVAKAIASKILAAELPWRGGGNAGLARTD